MNKHIFLVLSALAILSTASCTINKYYNTPEEEDDTPKLKENEVLLSFDTNGGTPVKSIAVPKNTKLDLCIHIDLNDITNITPAGGKLIEPVEKQGYTIKNPTKPGKMLGGWCTNASCSNNLPRNGFQVTENTTIYAKWVDPCVITLDANGGTCETSSVSVPLGNTVYCYWIISEGRSTCFVDDIINAYYKSVKVPTKSGKQFAGWYRDPNDETTSFSYPKTFYASAPITLKAKWADPCTIKFHNDGYVNIPDEIVPQGMHLAMRVNGDWSHELRIDGNSVLMRVNNNKRDPYPVRAGMRIVGWYLDADFHTPVDGINGNGFDTTGVSSIELFAKWE